MCLDRSCQKLEIGKRHLVADRAVFAGQLCRGERVLRIDNFKHGGLAGGVAKAREAQALGRGLHAEIERCELVAGGRGLGIELVELRDQLALRRGERDAGGVAQDLDSA